MHLHKHTTLFLALLFVAGSAGAQLPAEVFGGNNKTSFDVMFFRLIRKKNNAASHWLFFNRNRASIDYEMTPTQNLPQFGFTEAISYNHPKLKGFAPVAVVQLLNRGVYPKAGVQYARTGKQFTLFTWLVSETLRRPNLDHFLLLRYTPPISKRLHLFTQLETVSTLPTHRSNNYNFIQRARLGLKPGAWQYGLGADFTASGRNSFVQTENWGLFLRHEF